jgi:ABC-2 family transporter protein
VIWLTLRQHRLQFLSVAALLAAFAGLVSVTRSQMDSFSGVDQLNDCLASGGDCSLISHQFQEHFNTFLNTSVYLNLLPLVIGLFWGAPLLAYEVEHGTHRLVWTQTPGRGGWLTVKLAAMVIATTLAGIGMALLVSWWFEPFQRVASLSRISPDTFGLVGIVPVGYALFAFALAAASGAILRRTLPAMGVTLVGFAAARLLVANWRASFIAPLQIVYPPGGPSPRAGRGDWVLSGSGYVDAHGHRFDLGAVDRLCGPGASDPTGLTRCLHDHGLQHLDLYHPDSQFWTLQGIETAVFLVLAAALIAVTVYWALRRLS